MKLITNWKEVLRESLALWAAYAGVALSAASFAQEPLTAMLPALKPVLSADAYSYLSFVCFVLIPVLRVIDQGLAKLKLGQETTP